MLISKTVKMKWNSRNKNRFVSLGYHFTKMDDVFDCKVKDLSDGSNVSVNCMCDYCGKIYTVKWYSYIHMHKTRYIDNDCCKDCQEIKAKETIMKKYGVNNIRELPEINERIKNTNIIKYGCENPFGNKDIQNKIIQSNIKKYNVKYTMQCPDIVKKSKETCMKKYGVSNYGAIFSKEHTGINSPTWKGDNVIHERSERNTPEYRDWRMSVFSRDNYTCDCCGTRNGNGKYVRLEAHHIYSFKNFPDKRYDVENGVTLCCDCHILFHRIYGKKDFNYQQYIEFKNNINKKIC